MQFNVPVFEIRSKTREWRVLSARYSAISISYQYTNNTLSELARYFRLKSHATIINSIREFDNVIDLKSSFRTTHNNVKGIVEMNEEERFQLTENYPFVYNL
jgi:chromosomal replication initiation ATPase DnaA